MILLALAAPIRPVRTFLAPDSILGFGLSDYIEIALALFVVLALAAWIADRRRLGSLLEKTGLTMFILAALPVVLRLALLPRCPVPIPSGADDFSYTLLADTLRHFRLANPPHAFPQAFEQIFVLQQPTYSSMFALGQGLVLALGWLLFGHPWAGVLLSVAALCAASYWMLRAWTSPLWAAAGGLLAIFEFGPLSYWTNSYWGGAVAATAGCLVFGALPRVFSKFRPSNFRRRDAALLGLGLAIHILTRPFESLFLLLSIVLFLLPALRTHSGRKTVRDLAVVGCPILVATAGLMLLHDRRVTGSWTTLPYMLSRYQYGVPSTFTVQPNPVPHREMNDEQTLAFKAQSAIHGTEPETLHSYLERLLFRLRFVRFFLLPPVYIAVWAFFGKLREFRFMWVALTVAIFALGTNFYPYFYPHYVGALASLFLLISVASLEKLDHFQIAGRALPIPAGGVLLLICVVHWAFWYGVHAVGSRELLSAVGPLETWNYINYGDPQGRIAVIRQLSRQPGKKLIFVHYAPGHSFEEWVHNEADIDRSSVVWAHDLGPVENQQLLRYYPDRKAWLLQPDTSPPKLMPYRGTNLGFQDVP